MPISPRRSRASTSSLPVELLRLIFIHRSEDDIEADTTQTTPAVTIGMVSRQWRAITLETPLLWRRIAITDRPNLKRDWNTVEEFLRRSKNAPIRAKLEGPVAGHLAHDTKALQLVYVLSFQIQRLEAFEVSGYRLEHMNTILANLPVNGSAPMLQSIKVWPVQNDRQGNYKPELLNKVRSAPLFNCQMPAMRQVITRDIPLPLGMFTGLRKLDVRNRMNFRPDELISFLRQSPQLEVLSVGTSPWTYRMGTWSDDTTPYPSTPIELPNLRYLSLWGEQDGMLHIVAHMIFPPTIELYLQLYAESDSTQAIDSHCHSLRHSMSRFQELTLDYIDDPTIASCSLALESPDRRWNVSWLIDERQGDAVIPRDSPLLSMRLNLLRLPALKHLRIAARPVSVPLPTFAWQLLLKSMPSLRTIEVDTSEPPPPPLLDLEGNPVPEPMPPSRMDWLLPMFYALSQPTAGLESSQNPYGVLCPWLETVRLSRSCWGLPEEPYDMTHMLFPYVDARRQMGITRRIEIHFR